MFSRGFSRFIYGVGAFYTRALTQVNRRWKIFLINYIQKLQIWSYCRIFNASNCDFYYSICFFNKSVWLRATDFVYKSINGLGFLGTAKKWRCIQKIMWNDHETNAQSAWFFPQVIFTLYQFFLELELIFFLRTYSDVLDIFLMSVLILATLQLVLAVEFAGLSQLEGLLFGIWNISNG